MSELDTFIHEARDKGLSDDQISKALISAGWDSSEVDAGLHGLTVPKPSKDSAPVRAVVNHNTASTGPLHSALHHVLLWFFLVSASISIGAAVSSLYGARVSTTALASLIAVTIVTFTPYLIFFLLFLRQTHRNPKIIPGKVWSIITICLASVGAMAAAITLVVNLVRFGEPTIIITTLLLIALYAITIVTYGFAVFASEKAVLLRKIILASSLPAFAILMGSLFIMSLLQLGPARHDETIRTNMVTTVGNIAEKISEKESLPTAEEAKPLIADPSITYTPLSSTTYELCAEFQTTSNPQSQSYNYYRDNSRQLSDSYVYESDFDNEKNTQCFTVESNYLSLERKDSN